MSLTTWWPLLVSISLATVMGLEGKTRVSDVSDALEMANRSVAVGIQEPASGQRRRRDIFHLYSMMSCTTNCDPLSYKGYGCYCGFLGSGDIVDPIDRCCKKHDYCYGSTPCRHQTLIYFVPYKWKCNGGHPYCVLNYSESGEVKQNDQCAHHLCECDRQFAECIRHYPCPGKKAYCSSNPLRSLG